MTSSTSPSRAGEGGAVSATTYYHFCPVCRREHCGHLIGDIEKVAQELERGAVSRTLAAGDLRRALQRHAKTPLDRGVANFAADVFELYRGAS